MKLTKREYTKQMTDLTTRRNITANYLNKIIDNIQYIGRVVTEEEVTKINRLHDKVAEFDQAMRDLDRRWETRNWTAGDWSSHALVAANID
jgi:hypothetical protein